MVTIRKASAADADQIWEIFSKVIESEDTYVFTADTPRSDLRKNWFATYMTTFVAEDNGEILGTYIIKPNQTGLGNHIANCSYMVHPDHQGKGTGTKMCEHSIQFAMESGYKGIQFNIVVSTNTGAIELWKKFGFRITGTTPGGFRHRNLGMVDTHIMFKEL